MQEPDGAVDIDEEECLDEPEGHSDAEGADLLHQDMQDCTEKGPEDDLDDEIKDDKVANPSEDAIRAEDSIVDTEEQSKPPASSSEGDDGSRKDIGFHI